MSKQNIASLWLSKKLKEVGWDEDNEKCNYYYAYNDWHKKWSKIELVEQREIYFIEKYQDKALDTNHMNYDEDQKFSPAPHLLDDLCIKYKEEVFGEDIFAPSKFSVNSFSFAFLGKLLQQGKKDEAEKYIWDNCKLNSKNI